MEWRLLILGLLLSGSAFGDVCQVAYEAARRAVAENDGDTLLALYEETAGCDRAFRDSLGRSVARSMVRSARSASSPETAASLLSDSLQYARLWQALAMLGDIHNDARRYGQATRYYQEALDVIGDEKVTPEPPDTAIIAAIFRKAERTRLLADDFVEPVTRSDGSLGGLAAANIRGFVPESVAIPVTFEFDSVAFTPKGQRAAKALLDMVNSESLRSLTLIGHTDPTGTESYNLELSKRRARAVADYLERAGFTGTIRTEGRGEGDPPALDAPASYATEELHQLYRRVELVRD